ncbi:hypothetical protein Slin15195_G055850 [Septoria linicola]|uniref:Uncharacterized protein n=1 Tax=Septoria linicola TaxID=215465 RepID=A0A9Q9AUR4_9PEZI|nr:hypothetical protein Slin14017_G071720 [Septoria linicola]USW52266.1 hypothetical protein Slin15195_G055850 [Septoria linicola]
MSAPNLPEQRGLLSDASPVPTASPPTPFSGSARHRPGYTRVSSVSFNDTPQTRDITDTVAEDDITPAPAYSQSAARNHGLGIISEDSLKKDQPSISSPTQQVRTPVNARRTPEQSHELYSPPSTGAMTGSTRFEENFDEISYNPKHKDSRISLQSGAPSTYAKSDTGLLSVRSAYNDFAPHDHCASKKAYRHGRFNNWISVTILTLAVFATAFSFVFLIIALRGPRYGRKIRNGGSLTPSSAAFLTSLFAKLIELSFVTVVVAFVGQALARRAHTLEQARGVTLAELNMRAWILQPGTMLTQWESVRYAGVSFLGGVSFLAALLAILYTSAATALVQPQLVLPGFQSHTLHGLVKSAFANPTYIADECQTPITEMYDPEYSGTTCLQIQHSSDAFHNYYSYLATWADATKVNGNATKDLATRPKGYALFADNTTIEAPWIERTEVTQEAFPGYIINNVTMAMPHIGVVQAAADPINDIMQPYEVDGATYSIRASVPSPVVNVLCVTLSEAQLTPFVYDKWTFADGGGCNRTDWVTNGTWPTCAGYQEGTGPYLDNPDMTKAPEPLLNDIFRWGEKWGANRYPPIFPKLPIQYNTLINETKGMTTTYGPTSIYLLGRGGPVDSGGNSMIGSSGAKNYALCSLSAGQTPLCTTHYNASSSGGSMSAMCNTTDPLQYNRSESMALMGNDTLSKDWVNIASEWSRSLSFGAGLADGNASNARLLTQFIVTSGNLSAANPSAAEALAVLAGNTLIQSSTDAPFTLFWNYTNPTLEQGVYQTFNASVRVQQYGSGGSADYQKPFHLVLVAVFLMSAAILVYFLCHRHWYTDFSEPVHLFSLAVNSPPSQELAGSCGCGPSGEQFKVSWKLHKDGEHFYVDSQKSIENTLNIDSPRFSRRRFTQTFEMDSPVGKLKDRFSRQFS